MSLVFWQNVISIHQSAFIKSLSAINPVTLVVERECSAARLKEGWKVPQMGNARIIIAPDDSKISELLADKESYHIFSGIDANPMVYAVFKQAAKNHCRIAVMLEPYKWLGITGLLRRLKYKYLRIRYEKYINVLFVTGYKGEECYIKSGFSREKIYQWGYFTEHRHIHAKSIIEQTKPNIIFIGRLDVNKNILNLVKVIKTQTCLFNTFYIIGNGSLESRLLKIIEEEQQIKYVGAIPNENITDYLSRSDLLILPSLYDGWGAVVNEALMCGTRVLCSENCGASALLDNNERGGVFCFDEHNSDMKMQLRKWLEKGPITQEQRRNIINWTYDHISGDNAATYFNAVLTDPDKRIIPSWLNND